VICFQTTTQGLATATVVGIAATRQANVAVGTMLKERVRGTGNPRKSTDHL